MIKTPNSIRHSTYYSIRAHNLPVGFYGNAFFHRWQQFLPNLMTEDSCSAAMSLEAEAEEAYRNRNYAEAAKNYGKLRGRGLRDRELWSYAVSLRMIGELDEAKEVFKEIIKNDETSGYEDISKVQLAIILYQKNEIENAIEELAKIEKRFPGIVKSHLNDEEFSGLEGLISVFKNRN